MADIRTKYSDLYLKERKNFLWPTEFVVRALLGKNYEFGDRSKTNAALDLGFGDGRNLELLTSLYTNVYGLEISEAICQEASAWFPNVEFLTGYSHDIASADSFFDLVLAAHSIYYCDFSGIEKNFAEVNRVLRESGRFVFSILKRNSYLVANSKLLEDDYVQVSGDPLGVRNGSLLKYYTIEEDLIELLKRSGFGNISVGSSENNWWGIKEFCWIVSCNKV